MIGFYREGTITEVHPKMFTTPYDGPCFYLSDRPSFLGVGQFLGGICYHSLAWFVLLCFLVDLGDALYQTTSNATFGYSIHRSTGRTGDSSLVRIRQAMSTERP